MRCVRTRTLWVSRIRHAYLIFLLLFTHRLWLLGCFPPPPPLRLHTSCRCCRRSPRGAHAATRHHAQENNLSRRENTHTHLCVDPVWAVCRERAPFPRCLVEDVRLIVLHKGTESGAHCLAALPRSRCYWPCEPSRRAAAGPSEVVSFCREAA